MCLLRRGQSVATAHNSLKILRERNDKLGNLKIQSCFREHLATWPLEVIIFKFIKSFKEI